MTKMWQLKITDPPVDHINGVAHGSAGRVAGD